MDRKTFEEIMDLAIEREKEAEVFYTEVAKRLTARFMKELFTDLAAEEAGHRKTLTNLKKRDALHQVFKETPDYGISETVEKPEVSDEMAPAQALTLAMKKEEEAMKYYGTLADGCEDPDLRETLLELSKMEQGHKTRLEKAFVDIGYPEVW